MKKYVAGFLFNKRFTEVLLIEKNHPEWQKGKWNGIGGKINENEPAIKAMEREFGEEVGLSVTTWEEFCVLKGANDGGWQVHFYYATHDKIESAKQMETEKPRVVKLFGNEGWKWNVIPNLAWLIPMAINFGKDRENCIRFEVTEI